MPRGRVQFDDVERVDEALSVFLPVNGMPHPDQFLGSLPSLSLGALPGLEEGGGHQVKPGHRVCGLHPRGEYFRGDAFVRGLTGLCADVEAWVSLVRIRNGAGGLDYDYALRHE